jgi:hypothetical protein
MAASLLCVPLLEEPVGGGGSYGGVGTSGTETVRSMAKAGGSCAADLPTRSVQVPLAVEDEFSRLL